MPDGYPTIGQLSAHHWLPIPRERCRSSASLQQAATTSPGFDRVKGLARAWGSRLVDLGNVGHLNPASGFGEWPRAEQLIDELCLTNVVASRAASVTYA